MRLNSQLSPSSRYQDAYEPLSLLAMASLSLLLFLLPFATRQPVVSLGSLSLNWLGLFAMFVEALATLTLAGAALSPRGRKRMVGLWGGDRRSYTILVLFAAAILTGLASSIQNNSLNKEPQWFVYTLAPGLVAFALPLWLSEKGAAARIEWVAAAFVAGAAASASIGILEYAFQRDLERVLVIFRAKPTTFGSVLRLTGPFGHANEAGMYFALALPFALNHLFKTWTGGNRTWLSRIVWLVISNVLLASLFLTLSRGAILAFVIASLAMVLAARHALWAPVSRNVPQLVLLAANAVVLLSILAWKTSFIDSVRLSNQTDASFYAVSFKVNDHLEMKHSAHELITVRVENRSPLIWKRTTGKTYQVGYHWMLPSWRVERFDNPMVPLSRSLPPDGAATMRIPVEAPATPGKYLLVWDLLAPSGTWFNLRTGDFSVTHVLVSRSISGASGQRAVPKPDPYRPFGLPLAQTATRPRIWLAAWRMILSHPLLGLGPSGFVDDYYQYVHAPRPLQARPPSNAHNLFLQLAVGVGLIGMFVVSVLFLVVWWPLIAESTRGMVEPGIRLALVGAATTFLVQGMVEFLLGTLTISVVFWFFGGLAQVKAAALPADSWFIV